MQKIKFKIAYKPLSTEQVNKHKDFDALMGMYAAAPKLNFFQKLFKNKWTMFSGGIIIGGLIATVIALNSTEKSPVSGVQQNETNNTTITLPSNTSENVIPENHSALAENTASPDQTNETLYIGDNHIIADEFTAKQELPVKTTAEILPNEIVGENNSKNTPKANRLSDNNATTIPVTSEKSNTVNNIPATDINSDAMVQKRTVSESAQIIKIRAISEYSFNSGETNTAVSIRLPNENVSTLLAINTGNQIDPAITTQSPVQTNRNSIPTPDTSILVSAVSEVAALALNIEKKADAFFEQITQSKKENKDSIAQVGNIAADSASKIQPELNTPASEFIDRYAQLSFFTPISSNGIEGYKYYHHFSVNMIQGYNGAVQGLEVGGVLNADKGYVIGGQFAGVGNIIGGDLTGMQGAGVFNFAKSTAGMQYAGVANYNKSGMRGMQGAGVVNYAGGNVLGMQAAGVINIASGTNYSGKLMQAAGVINIATSNNLTGMQVSGVINAANNLTGAQVGIVNIAKKITGTQIGLINIADTIDGVAIGLFSFSRNGIFDVEVFHSDLFLANIALRFGSPYIYNTFAIGINPAADTIQYGFGLGLGGHIPVVNKIAVDIDGMIWNTFEDNFDFNYDYVHLMNQFRVMPSYAITKYLSIYGGPVINVEVYDNNYTPLKENTFASYDGVNVTTGLSLGYVVGIRLF